MKLLIIILSLILSSCIYVEGQIIQEPKDVKIRDSSERFAYWERCATVDVTEKNKQDV